MPACIVLALLGSASSAPAVSRSATSGWAIVPGANTKGCTNALNAVAASPEGDVWAVGKSSPNCFAYVGQTLVERWTGSAWQIVKSPDVGLGRLYGVAAFSHHAAWAVGMYLDGIAFRTLIDRWDGRTWKQVPSPNVGDKDNILQAVGGAGPSDVWALGYYLNSKEQIRTLALHWNGAVWKHVQTPAEGVSSVVALSGTDVWMVGSWRNHTTTVHWDGSVWTRVPSPNVGRHFNALSSVSGRNADDLWAVGSYDVGYDGGFPIRRTLVEHWDGSAWSVVDSRNPDRDDALTAVVARSSDDFWAVGVFTHCTGEGCDPNRTQDPDRTLVEHWNGKAWSRVSSPDASPYSDELDALAQDSSGRLWAVGRYYTGRRTKVLVEMRAP